MQLPVTVYRLAQYTLREAISLHFGDETAALLLRDAGWIAGSEFCKNVLDVRLEFPAFIDQLQKTLKEQLIGVLRVEQADLENMKFTLTVS